MTLNILVVDDAAFIREALIQICQLSGHIVVGEATNGQEAIDKATKLKPDVIIMDLVMPEKNGIEASREILEVWPNTKILACSSVDQEFLIAKAEQVGCVGFIAKPFKKQDIVDSLRNLSIQGPRLGGTHG
jgi:two-component system chemotaxis response regulator CheY